jgi:hypothetical protein
MRRYITPLLLAVTVLAIGGCDSSATVVNCPDIAVPGILVTVTDSLTQAPAGRNASIVARSAMFTDSVSSATTAASDGPFGLVYSRNAAGTYTLTVKQSGYRDWTKSGIVVAMANACSLRTVNVSARLQR